MKINSLLLASVLVLLSCGQTSKKEQMNTFYPSLTTYVQSVQSEIKTIPEARKERLREISEFIRNKKESNDEVNLIFICTHNSRRSHMGQIWASTAAYHYGIEGIKTFSGGTEATAFNPRAVAAIERAGFKVMNPGGENPHYRVTFADNTPSMECFSKKYDDLYNPSKNFAAIMTCSDADKNCPIVPGATFRASIPYEDPKEADGTEMESARYEERCKQIATEMFYIMEQVKS